MTCFLFGVGVDFTNWCVILILKSNDICFVIVETNAQFKSQHIYCDWTNELNVIHFVNPTNVQRIRIHSLIKHFERYRDLRMIGSFWMKIELWWINTYILLETMDIQQQQQQQQHFINSLQINVHALLANLISHFSLSHRRLWKQRLLVWPTFDFGHFSMEHFRPTTSNSTIGINFKSRWYQGGWWCLFWMSHKSQSKGKPYHLVAWCKYLIIYGRHF